MRLNVIYPICALIFFIFSCTKSNVEIYDLRCNHLTNPLGISSETPLFGWKISAPSNNFKPTKYQLLVATTPEKLSSQGADLWDSGQIEVGDESIVRYQGKPLSSGDLCYWKVRVWGDIKDGDKIKNKVSNWSQVGCYSIGLLKTTDWSGEYIGLPERDTLPSSSPQLWKRFELDKIGNKLFIHVNSLGYHELYVNGTQVNDAVLSPAVSEYPKRSHILTYDITDLAKVGQNDLILWIGQGFYTYGMPGVTTTMPVVRAELQQLNDGKWNKLLVTDNSWKGRASGYYSTSLGRSNKYGGEIVEGASLLTDLTAETLDSCSWRQVVEVEIPCHNVSPQQVETNALLDTIHPIAIDSLSDGSWLVDMGKNFVGWTYIKFPKLEPQQEIVLNYSDKELSDKGAFRGHGQLDKYIAKGSGDEYFVNKFDHKCYRYLLISNLKERPILDNIMGRLIQTNFDNISEFTCSDSDINAIHDMIQYTLRNLNKGGYFVDCQHIERLGYGGDGNSCAATAQIMFDLMPLYNNWIQAWTDCSREDGWMPHTAPNPFSAGGGPYWCGFIITASWLAYQNYGDISILQEHYPTMSRWIKYVERYSPNGLLEQWPNDELRTWFLGDWAAPLRSDLIPSDKRSVSLVNNCFVVICYDIMQKIAQKLNKREDANYYGAKATTLRGKVHSSHFNREENSYATGSQLDIAYPLLANVVPEELKDSVMTALHNEIEARDGHLYTGLIGVPVITELLTREAEAEAMYSMLKKREHPSYLYMIDNGATATWEYWSGERSRIHNCYNGIGSWFYESLAGIQRDDDAIAYREFIIAPQVVSGISWVKAKKPTPYGEIAVNWSKESNNNKFTLSVEIPVGTSATTIIPINYPNVVINGENVEPTDNHEYHLEAGIYQIEAYRNF